MSIANDSSPRELWEELGSYSTLHGLKFTFQKSSKVRRVVWILLMLGAGAFLANQIYHNVLKVMSHEVVLKYRSETRGLLDFPAISICNNNMFRRSRINGTFAQRYLDLLDPRKRSEWSKLKSGLNYSMDLEVAALQYGHNLSEMMYNGKCQWPGKTCSEQNFTKFFEPMYGLCYTFNSGKNGQQNLKVASIGISSGFAVVLDSQPEEYYGVFSYGGTGFRVIIHDQKEQYLIDKASMQISPGFNVEMKITRKEFTTLEAPYPTRCTKKEGYSRSRCRQQLYWNVTAQKCGCRVLGTVGENFKKVSFCTPWQARTCVLRQNLNDILPGKDHRCTWRCNYVEYDIQSSFMAFPSQSFVESLETEHNLSSSSSQLAELEKHYRRRYVRLSVYYGENKVDLASEEPVYTLIDLANDLGGSMGLFLGCSVLTVFEFIDVLVLMCVARWKRRKRTDVEANETKETKPDLRMDAKKQTINNDG